MGLLAPGILRVGDVPHLAALCLPRKLVIVGGTAPRGGDVKGKELTTAFAFTRDLYRLHGAEKSLILTETMTPDQLAREL
jgi:hypothetical protein